MQHGLILISDFIPGIHIDLIYTSNENFTGSSVYPLGAKAYLSPLPAFRLKLAHQALQKKGYGLKIWDAYRPVAVQQIFWQRVPDSRYVSNPATGSKHNRGAAIDVTLVDQNGCELPMQSAFDDFSTRAHRDYQECDPTWLKNVQLLTEAMVSAGFVTSQSEWWHFEDPDWENYPILDLAFEELL